VYSYFPTAAAEAAFLSFLVGAVEFLLAHRSPQAWGQNCCNLDCLALTALYPIGSPVTRHSDAQSPTSQKLTLHNVFGPSGPLRHSGESVLPHVTQTCIPSPASAPPTPAMLAFLARFFSLPSLSLSRVSLSLGGRPGPGLNFG